MTDREALTEALAMLDEIKSTAGDPTGWALDAKILIRAHLLGAPIKQNHAQAKAVRRRIEEARR